MSSPFIASFFFKLFLIGSRFWYDVLFVSVKTSLTLVEDVK